MTIATFFTILSAVGSVVQGISASRTAERNAQGSEANASAIRAQAEEAAKIGKDKRRREISALIAQRASSGLLVNDDSSLDIIEESFFNLTRDIQNTQLQGEVKVTEQLGKAANQRDAGRQALIGGFMNAGKTLLGSSIGKGGKGGKGGKSGGGTPPAFGTGAF